MAVQTGENEQALRKISSVAALNITGDLQLTICKGAENNWIVSVIFQGIASAFLSL